MKKFLCIRNMFYSCLACCLILVAAVARANPVTYSYVGGTTMTRYCNFSGLWKKLLFISMLLICSLLFTSSIHATPIKINLEGTMSDNGMGNLGWGENLFSIQFMIDSEKSPDFTDLWHDSDSKLHCLYQYLSDSIEFIVGGVNQSVDEARLIFYKDESWPTDMVTIQLFNEIDDWLLETDLKLDFCFLGYPPLPASTSFSLNDGEIYFANVINYSYAIGNSNIYKEYYDLSIKEFYSTPVPEPATILLFSFGLLGLAGVNRKKK